MISSLAHPKMPPAAGSSSVPIHFVRRKPNRFSQEKSAAKVDQASGKAGRAVFRSSLARPCTGFVSRGRKSATERPQRLPRSRNPPVSRPGGGVRHGHRGTLACPAPADQRIESAHRTAATFHARRAAVGYRPGRSYLCFSVRHAVAPGAVPRICVAFRRS